MSIYKRNYNFISALEEQQLNAHIIAKEIYSLYDELYPRQGIDIFSPLKTKRSTSVALSHHLSLFPNHHLDLLRDTYKNEKKYLDLLEDFKKELDKKGIKENDIKKWIEDNEAYHLIGQIAERYFGTGHHDLYIFPQFKLTTLFSPDYLVVARNSSGFSFIFVEMEAINEQITTKDGSISIAFNKGIKQVEDWRNFLQSEFYVLENEFKRYLKPNKSLPDEFRKYNQDMIFYCVVAGRRLKFNDRTRRQQALYKNNRIQLLHYDNLIDCVREKIKYFNE